MSFLFPRKSYVLPLMMCLPRCAALPLKAALSSSFPPLAAFTFSPLIWDLNASFLLPLAPQHVRRTRETTFLLRVCLSQLADDFLSYLRWYGSLARLPSPTRDSVVRGDAISLFFTLVYSSTPPSSLFARYLNLVFVWSRASPYLPT